MLSARSVKDAVCVSNSRQSSTQHCLHILRWNLAFTMFLPTSSKAMVKKIEISSQKSTISNALKFFSSSGHTAISRHATAPLFSTDAPEYVSVSGPSKLRSSDADASKLTCESAPSIPEAKLSWKVQLPTGGK